MSYPDLIGVSRLYKGISLRDKRPVSFGEKFANNLYFWVSWSFIGLGCLVLGGYIVCLTKDFEQAMPYFWFAFFPFFILIVIGISLISSRYRLRKKIECANCLKRYTKEVFKENNGKCPLCEGWYFNFYRLSRENDISPMDLIRDHNEMYVTKKRYKGEELLKILGGSNERD